MKLHLKIFSVFLTLALIMTAFSGCKESYQDAIIYFEACEKPISLDPQTASSDTELAIVKNIYEGLLRKNSSGSIVNGVAKSFTFNNLTYTFKLKDDVLWSNQEPLTAHDFVFAFRRAVSPETISPFASRLFCIKNAEKIRSGKATPSSLGVYATNDYTLVIKLEREDTNFEETLTTSVAMPCNEKFFKETQGKYALSSETTISNGSYYLRKWSDDPFGIRLYKYKDYAGSFEAKNSAVYITRTQEETPLERLKENSADIAFIDASLVDEAKENDIKTINYENICWVMTFNSKLTYNQRKALSMLVGNQVFGENLKSGYSPAVSLFPSALKVENSLSGTTPYNLESAKALYATYNGKNQNVDGSSAYTLYYYNSPIIKSVVADIAGHWQNNLGKFVVNIKPSDNLSALTSQLNNPDLDIAVFPIRAESENINEYLAKFNKKPNGSIGKIQTEILSNNQIVPLVYQNTTIAHTTALNNVYTTLGNGYIDFSLIIKTEK